MLQPVVSLYSYKKQNVQASFTTSIWNPWMKLQQGRGTRIRTLKSVHYQTLIFKSHGGLLSTCNGRKKEQGA